MARWAGTCLILSYTYNEPNLQSSVEDLETFCRITFGVQGRNPNIAPILYRQPTMPEKLRFGYYTGQQSPGPRMGLALIDHSDFYVKTSPANKRAVLETVAALRSQGHECIEIEVPDR